jgi:hypothetical protein
VLNKSNGEHIPNTQLCPKKSIPWRRSSLGGLIDEDKAQLYFLSCRTGHTTVSGKVRSMRAPGNFSFGRTAHAINST